MSVSGALRGVSVGAALLACAAFALSVLAQRRPATVTRAALGAVLVLAGMALAAAASQTLRIGPLVLWEGILTAAATAAAANAGGAAPAPLRVRACPPSKLSQAAWLLVSAACVGSVFTLNRRLSAAADQLGLSSASERYEPARDQACPENLKSLYTAFQMYTQDWEALPPAAAWMDNRDLTSKVSRDEWLHCPAVSDRHDAHYGYAYNLEVAGRKIPGGFLKQMRGAATTPLLFDSADLARSATDGLATLPRPGRHAGRDNVLYCDGHVAAVTP